jgi:hypothetical protein
MTAHDKNQDTTQKVQPAPAQRQDAVPQAVEKDKVELAEEALDKVSGGGFRFNPPPPRM